jgi:hypothetical protein
MKINTHNGEITVKSLGSGEHRTFRVRTQKADSVFAPGQRIVSLLTGSDNETDYRGFGFVGENGVIKVWRKQLGTQMEKFARMLENLEHHVEKGQIEINFDGTCRKCNRKLTTPESVANGIGPVCASKI